MLILSPFLLYVLVFIFVLSVFVLFMRVFTRFDHWLDESEDNDL